MRNTQRKLDMTKNLVKDLPANHPAKKIFEGIDGKVANAKPPANQAATIPKTPPAQTRPVAPQQPVARPQAGQNAPAAQPARPPPNSALVQPGEVLDPRTGRVMTPVSLPVPPGYPAAFRLQPSSVQVVNPGGVIPPRPGAVVQGVPVGTVVGTPVQRQSDPFSVLPNRPPGGLGNGATGGRPPVVAPSRFNAHVPSPAVRGPTSGLGGRFGK